MFDWFREPKPILQKLIMLVPLAWVIVKTFFRIITPEGIGIAILMSALDVLCFELLIMLFIYLLIQLGPNARRINWKRVTFYMCFSIIPLVVADVAMPLAQQMAYDQFPTFDGTYSFADLEAAATPLYQFIVMGPYIWSAICTVAFFPSFIYGMKLSLDMKWHLVIPFAITVAVISWVLGSVVAGIPFGGFTGV